MPWVHRASKAGQEPTCETFPLRHVHLHDNKGGSADLHLPLGAGNMDTTRCLKALKTAGYNGTITLEIFTPDRHYLTYSRDQFRQRWNVL